MENEFSQAVNEMLDKLRLTQPQYERLIERPELVAQLPAEQARLLALGKENQVPTLAEIARNLINRRLFQLCQPTTPASQSNPTVADTTSPTQAQEREELRNLVYSWLSEYIERGILPKVNYDRAIAQDLRQESLKNIVASLHNCEKSSSFLAFCGIIVTRVIARYYKQQYEQSRPPASSVSVPANKSTVSSNSLASSTPPVSRPGRGMNIQPEQLPTQDQQQEKRAATLGKQLEQVAVGSGSGQIQAQGEKMQQTSVTDAENEAKEEQEREEAEIIENASTNKPKTSPSVMEKVRKLVNVGLDSVEDYLPADEQTAPENIVLRKEQVQRILDRIMNIKTTTKRGQQYRNILLDTFIRGLTDEEIGQKYGLEVVEVQKRRSYIIKKLREDKDWLDDLW